MPYLGLLTPEEEDALQIPKHVLHISFPARKRKPDETKVQADQEGKRKHEGVLDDPGKPSAG